jgi:hypothetical protein
VEFEAKEEAKKLQLIPGPAGAAGASLNPRGTFVDGETYNRLDVVTWLGSSYIAAVDGVKEKPSKNSNQWQVLASRGSGGSGGAGDFGSLAGVAQINQGGTGQTTRAAGLNALLPSQTGNVQYMLLTDGAGNVSWGAQPVAGLPSQTGNSGELLTTDGVNASWSNAITVSGSNATVAGTLTLNNNVAQYWLDSGATQRRTALVSGGNATYFGPVDAGWASTGYFSAGTSMILRTNGASGTFNEAVSISTGGIVTIASTSSSTTTSTGALVVGNGTSGGLGVGGAINAGGAITVSVGNGVAATLGLNQTGVANAYLTQKATSGDLALGNGGGDQLTIAKANGAVSITSSSASTSTSSGALVVSGGVGVGGKVTATSVGVANTSQSIAAWGDVGAQLSVAGAVLTDTSSSGTVARIVTNSIASSALAASSTTTYTAAASLFIAGGPTANTNVTITNAYAIYTAAGRINFQGLPTSSAGLQAGTLWNDSGTLKVA